MMRSVTAHRENSFPALSAVWSVPNQYPSRPRAGLLAGLWIVVLCKLIIGAVAVYDVYLTVKYAKFLHILEQNPLGRWLMNLDQGPVSDLQQIAAFITAKFAGTLIVVMILQLISQWRTRLAIIVALPVASFQLYLAYYLTYWTFR